MEEADLQPLTDKQKMFVKEYVVDFNGAQAAIRAGYSVNSAKEQASRLLTKDNVTQAVQLEIEARNRRVEISQDKILQELGTIALARVTDYLQIKPGGKEILIYGTDEVDIDKIAAVAEVKQTKEGISIKLHDKLKAIELLGKHIGMWKDDPVEVKMQNINAAVNVDSVLKEWKKIKTV